LLDHVCRFCLGRLLSDPWRNVVRCARCGIEANGPVESLCMCGVKAGPFDRLFVCVRNPEKTEAHPNEIVAMEAPGQAETPKKTPIPDAPKVLFFVSK